MNEVFPKAGHASEQKKEQSNFFIGESVLYVTDEEILRREESVTTFSGGAEVTFQGYVMHEGEPVRELDGTRIAIVTTAHGDQIRVRETNLMSTPGMSQRVPPQNVIDDDRTAKFFPPESGRFSPELIKQIKEQFAGKKFRLEKIGSLDPSFSIDTIEAVPGEEGKYSVRIATELDLAEFMDYVYEMSTKSPKE